MDDFHLCSTNGTGDGGSFFLSAGKHAEGIDPQYHLKEFNEFLAAWMKESITPSSAKTLGQDMAHEQIKKFFSSHGPSFVLFGFCGQVAEGHHAVFASQDVLFLNDSPVKISSKVNDGLVAVADAFAMNNPLFGTIPGQFETLIDQGFQHLCPEDLCQGPFVEEVSGLFLP